MTEGAVERVMVRSMTPSEKKALLFLALVALLGATVRAVRAMREDAPPPAAARAALARQIQAVDSAGAAARAKAAGRGRTGPRAGGARGVATAPSAAAGEPRGRIATVRAGTPAFTMVPGPSARIDLDVAGAAEIQRLPRVGPVLARRIVADRDTFGPFGTIDNLRRVPGVGPVLAKRLEPLVTFSLTPRPPNAVFGRVKPPPTPRDSSLRRGRGRRPPA
jgi:competence protein ComEA